MDSYPIPRPEDLHALNGGKNTPSLTWLMPIYKWNSMTNRKSWSRSIRRKGYADITGFPLGQSAPGIFQNVMDTMLTGIPRAVAYLDDIILTGSTNEEHWSTLETVLSRLVEFGFRVKREKCKFFEDEVEYLGHIISAEGVRADPKKAEAIRLMQPP
uniref:Reverse transcriptase domain-containing protein n=1 Tax=Trichuris muris TaxID=70415 RepID=A0A5S6QFZ0_TRIMR